MNRMASSIEQVELSDSTDSDCGERARFSAPIWYSSYHRYVINYFTLLDSAAIMRHPSGEPPRRQRTVNRRIERPAMNPRLPVPRVETASMPGGRIHRRSRGLTGSHRPGTLSEIGLEPCTRQANPDSSTDGEDRDRDRRRHGRTSPATVLRGTSRNPWSSAYRLRAQVRDLMFIKFNKPAPIVQKHYT